MYNLHIIPISSFPNAWIIGSPSYKCNENPQFVFYATGKWALKISNQKKHNFYTNYFVGYFFKVRFLSVQIFFFVVGSLTLKISKTEDI